MAPPRTPQTALLSLLSVLVLAETATAQNFESISQPSPILRASGSFPIDLAVGGILIAATPSYTRDAIAETQDDPDGSFSWGLGVSIGGVVMLVLLTVTIISLLVAVPRFLAPILLSIVGDAVSMIPLGALTPILGSVILFVVDMLGLGVVGRNLVCSWA